jgi:putative transposase
MVDFLLTRKRKRLSAQSFLIKVIENNGKPELINIDKSGSNTAAIKVYNKRSFSKIKYDNVSTLTTLLSKIIV